MAALYDILNEALANDIQSNLYDCLRWILVDYVEYVRLALGQDPPVKVPLMHLMLRHDACPVKTKSRRYPSLYEAFLEDPVQQVLDFSLLRMNFDRRFSKEEQ